MGDTVTAYRQGHTPETGGVSGVLMIYLDALARNYTRLAAEVSPAARAATRDAGTISYEILTSLGHRYERRYL